MFDGSFMEKIWGSNLTGKELIGLVLEMYSRGQWCGVLSKPTKCIGRLLRTGVGVRGGCSSEPLQTSSAVRTLKPWGSMVRNEAKGRQSQGGLARPSGA